MFRRHDEPEPAPPRAPEPLPTLVSFGVRTVPITGRGGRPDELVEIESAYDKAHPSRIYWRYAGSNGPWTPTETNNSRDSVGERFTMPRRRDHVSAHYPAGRSDEHTPLPGPTAAEREISRVVFGTRDR